MDKFVLEKIISDSSDIEFFSSSEAEPDTQNLMLKITEKEIEDCIKILVNNHWQKPGKLPEGHAVLSSYKILSLSYTIMDDTNKKLIRDIISKQYVPSSISPGTIGSFLFGCINQDYGEVDRHCSPLCLGGMDSKPCEKQMWTQSGEKPRRFIRMNNSDASEAYVYVEKGFVGFTEQEISDLQEANVSIVTVLNTRDGRHYTKFKNKKISECPMLVERNDRNNNTNTNIEETQDYTYYVILFIAFIIVIALFFKYRS